MGSLTGKAALVTGASRGIGRAIAERLGREGASVIVNYAARADQAKEVVAEVESTGGKALALQADMGKVVEIRRLFERAVDWAGRLDIAVTNAGVFRPKPLTEVTEEEFEETMAINARGTFFAL